MIFLGTYTSSKLHGVTFLKGSLKFVSARSCLAHPQSLTMEAICSSEMSGCVRTTRHQKQADGTLHTCCCFHYVVSSEAVYGSCT
jgi:hypothetical protein